MSNLSIEDLSFFDSHSKPSSNSKSTSSSHNRPGSLADLSFLYGSNSSTANTPTTNGNEQKDGNDDFGDFVESEDPSSVLTPQPAKNTTSLNENSTPVPSKPPKVPIESQISDLASFPENQILFGQHLVDKKSANGTTAARSTVTTTKQWNELLSSRQSPVKEQQETEIFNGKPRSRSTVKPTTASFLDEPWDSFGPDYDNLVDIEEDHTTYNITPSQQFANSIPHSETLLIYIHENVLPFIETKLLANLSSLSYQLRKRVLAHSKTRGFVKGYLELLRVSDRVMIGRLRRALKSSKADIEARQSERVWQSLLGRVKSIITQDSPSVSLPQLNSKVTFPPDSSNTSELCPVCGLYKTEFVKGQPKPTWNSANDKPGHKTCIAFWENRKTFGI